jgi:hypothetical protein
VAAFSAGCGGSSSLALDPVAAAATKTQQAGAARIRFALELSGPRTDGHKLRLTGLGAIDGTSSELTIGLGSLAGQSFAPGIGAKATVTEISLEQHGDYLLFLRAGFLTAHLPGGKHWLGLDVSKLGRAAGLGSLMSGSQVSPEDVLSMLKAEGSKVRNLGPATVDGATTTHYRITIDVAKALQAKGLTSPLLARIAVRMPTVPVDVWIGEDGLLHRVQAAFASGSRPARLSLTMDIYDYGAHLTIAAPPSSEVFDVTQLAQQRFGTLFN